MIDVAGLGTEVVALGTAIGLLSSGTGGVTLRSDFFSSPADHLGRMISDPVQRDALVTAIEGLLPAATPGVADDTATTTFHPILTTSPGAAVSGRLFLYVQRAAGRTEIGLSAEATAPTLAGAAAAPALALTMPLVAAAGNQLTVVAASRDTPLRLELRVPFGAAGTELRVSLLLVAPPDLDDTRFLVGLYRPDAPPLLLDPFAAPAGLAELAAGLLTALFDLVAADAPPEVRDLAATLPTVLGLAGGLPPFPYASLNDPATAVRGWLSALATSAVPAGGNALAVWLDAVGRLLGAEAATTFPAPTEAEPAVLELLTGPPALALTAGVRTDAATGSPVLVLGLRAEMTATGVDAALSAEATLLALPLTGTTPVTVLASLDVVVRAPAGPEPLVPAGGPVAVDGLRCGLRYAAGSVQPVVQVTGVRLGPDREYPVLDLTDTATLGAVADDVVDDALKAGLGEAGDLVAALRVLLGWRATAPALDLAAFASAPGRALLGYYRALLGDADGWQALLGAVWRLLGGTGAAPTFAAAGTGDDPWLLPVAAFATPPGALPTLSVAVWNDSDPGDGTIRLRLGLHAEVAGTTGATWRLAFRGDLLGFDLAADGATTRWLGHQTLRLTVTGLPAAAAAGVGVGADALTAALDWTPGSPLTVTASLDGVTVTADGTTVALGALRLPADLDPDDPALGLGIAPADLWAAARLLLGRIASSWGGAAGATVATLLGVGAGGTPPLELPDPADLRSLLDGPLAALRDWLSRVAADGSPVLAVLREPLQVLLTDRLPALLGGVPEVGVPPGGAGSFADPWTVPLQQEGAAPVELLAWMEPDGPPLAGAEPVLAALDAGDLDVPGILDAAAQLAAYLGAAGEAAAGAPAAGLIALAGAWSAGDGIVPADVALPAAPGWDRGALDIRAPHHLLPRHGDAVTQILDRVTTLTAGLADGGWAVLLLAPELAGADCWAPLLAAAGTTAQVADLRQATVAPELTDLMGLTAAGFYDVRLADDGTAPLDGIVAQLNAVTTRVTALLPGARLLFVAHSCTAPVAEAWVAAHPAATLGLVTLGGALGTVAIPGLDDPATADGLRLLARLAPGGLGDWTLDALTEHLSVALTGGYPAGAFARGPETRPELAGVPALALAGTVGDLPTRLGATLADAARGTGVLPDPDDPDVGRATHLAYGVRVGLPLPAAAATDPLVAVAVRLDLGRAELIPGADPPPQPATGLTVTLTLSGSDGPLLDSDTARVGDLTWSCTLAAGEAPELALRLRETVLDGVPAAAVELGDPAEPALLGRLIAHLDEISVPGGQLASVLTALADLGLVAGPAVVADAFTSLAADPAGYLGARLPALLDRPGGLLGVVRDQDSRDGAGPWRVPLGPLPVEFVVLSAPWRVTVTTTGEGLVTAADGRATGTGTLALADLSASTATDLSIAGLRLIRDGAGVSVAGSWLPEPVPLLPPDPARLRRDLAPLLPRLLLDAAVTALVEALAGPAARVGSLSRLLTDPAGWLASAFGDGALPDPVRLNDLLAAAARAAGLTTDAGRPLVLPGGLVLGTAAAAGGGLTVTLTLPETVLSPDGPALGLAAALTVDPARHVTPSGEISLRVPLPTAAGWDAVRLRFGADPTGLSAAVDVLTAADTTTVTLLPAVGGLADLLAAAATRLLPEALDALTGALPAGPGRSAALELASALGVYDSAQAPAGFVAKQDALAKLAADLAAGNLATLLPAATTALDDLLTLLLGPAAVHTQGTEVRVVLPFPVGALRVRADLATAPPSVRVTLDDVGLGPVTAAVTVGYQHPDVLAEIDLDLTVDTGLGLTLGPRLRAALTGDALAVDLLPLPATDPAIVVALAPQPQPVTAAELLRLAEMWLVPLAGTLALQAARPWLDRPLWTGAGKTTAQMLIDAGLADDQLHLTVVPIPGPAPLITGAVRGLSGLRVPLPGGVALSVHTDGPLLGLRVDGDIPIDAGDYRVSIALGAPAELVPWGDAGGGPTLFLLDTTDAARPRPTARLRFGGFGVAVTGRNDKALVDSNGLLLGSAAAYVTADLDLVGPTAFHRPADLDGAIHLTRLGLPLSPSGDGGNAVAASVLRSDGTGDPAPANPPVDLVLYGGSRGWGVAFNGKAEVRLDVQKTFGPLHLDDVILSYTGTPTAPGKFGIGVDGGVSIGGLVLEVQGLTLTVPVTHPSELNRWGIDLAGLSASLRTASVSVAGGLVKRDLSGGGVEYDGSLAVSVAGRGLSAIGSYARPGGSAGDYPSLFVFVVLNAPIGGPPYLFVTGLAGGLGYNRRLQIPSDPAAVPAFPLVAAMTDLGGASPMAALDAIAADIPPSRGGYWLAAGVKFSTFELLHTIALATLALDSGVEVGLLGLMQLQLPTAQDPLVSLELALAARYSTVDQVLSVRAALTRNSWLISEDCRLTGGFAVVVWFGKPEALLTVGGYGPLYHPRPYYPPVDEVGFNWAVGSGIVVKGGTYFVLAADGVAFGGRLEASYDVSPIRVWFTAYVDVLLTWDPLHYAIRTGVTVGASFHFEVCFFACVTISVGLSLSAQVLVEGPPLHGTVTVDLDIASVTVAFGDPPARSDALTWDQFRVKYLTGGDANGPATAGSVAAGVRTVDALPTAASGAPAFPPKPDGTAPASAWPVGPEFTLRLETHMPSMKYKIGAAAATAPGFPVPSHVVVVPAQSHLNPLAATLVVTFEQLTGGTFVGVPEATVRRLTVTPTTGGFPAALWVGGKGDGTGAPMVSALGGLTVAAPLTTAEATGTLGGAAAVPVAAMIHEEPARPLPLSGTAGTSLRRLPTARTAAAAEPVPQPALVAVIPSPLPHTLARGAAAAVTHRRPAPAPSAGGSALARPAPAPSAGGSTLARPAPAPSAGGSTLSQPASLGPGPGEAQRWELDPHAGRAHLDLTGGKPVSADPVPRADHATDADHAAGAGLRVTAVSATGAPLRDVAGPAEALGGRLPIGTATVIVAAPTGGPAAVDHAGETHPASAGWHGADHLLQVAPTTLLGTGCQLLTPRAFVPRRATGYVPAVEVASAMPGVTTVLPPWVSSVLIQLDRRDPGSGRTGLGDLVIAATGGRLGPPRRIDDGARTNLVLPVTEATGELRLAVASVADWWLAGVTGTGSDPDELIGVVTADPHVRLAAAVAAPVPAVAPVEVRLRIDPNGDRP